ncbi:1469_t:CDS:2 [Gigaspora margarita]|uniref:1469_t:CDS:1 n=1 Tax=Gigaspora margarita TaxID=4874 RepID=A0ABN7UPU0_GIGMA|nr:1469_t:CDS:2 [Gigaspora margarita]
MNEISELVILLNDQNILCVDNKNNDEHSINSHTQSSRNLEWYRQALEEGRIVKFEYSGFNNLREIGRGGYGVVYLADYGDQKESLAEIIFKIVRGDREVAIPSTPEDYVALYQKCWSAEPKQRPNLNEILGCLGEISKQADNKFITYNYRQISQRRPSTPSLIRDDSLSSNSSSDHSEYFSFYPTPSKQISIDTTNIITRTPRKFGMIPTSNYGETDKGFIFSFKGEKTIHSKVKNVNKAIYYKDEFGFSFGKHDLSLINDMALSYEFNCRQKNYNKLIRSSTGSFDADDYQVFEVIDR